MGLEFLARVRRSSIWLTAIVGVLIATYRGPLLGLALAAGAAWSLLNLFLLEKLIVSVITPDRHDTRNIARAGLALAGMLGLFIAGALIITRLSPIWLMGGFTIPLAVMVMKAASMMILPSATWRRITRSPWRAALVVGVFALGAWLVMAGMGGATPRVPHGMMLKHEAVSGAAAETHEGKEDAAAESDEEKGPQKFANVITVLHRAFPHAGWSKFLHEFEVLIYSFLVALILCLVAFFATRNPQMIPGPLQNAVEAIVEWIYSFVTGILGPKHGPRYVAFLGTLFVYILTMNLFGLIPFMDSPTSSLNVTVALALVVFLYSQYIGFRELGFVGYFDHLMGSPRSLIGWLLVPLMLPIHVMGELAKPISLSCRLFGNIFGEDMLLVAFVSLGITTLSFTHLPFGLPLQLPFMFLALLTSTLQALVFTVLSTIYFLLMLPHEDHEHEEVAQHAH